MNSSVVVNHPVELSTGYPTDPAVVQLIYRCTVPTSTDQATTLSFEGFIT